VVALAHHVQPRTVMRLHRETTPRDRLLARRIRLLHRFREATAAAADLTADREVELVDMANDQWEARVLSRLGDADSRQLGEIVAALRRLETGRYGTCIRCGTRIARARLELVPEASMCTVCAAYLEAHPER
jgi:RNA polymerase-binding transcription factor DksA